DHLEGMSNGCGSQKATHERSLDKVGRAGRQWNISIAPLPRNLGSQWCVSYRARRTKPAPCRSQAGSSHSHISEITAITLECRRRRLASESDSPVRDGP